MPYAITLCFDPASASAIENMWRTLAVLGIDSERDQLGYPPHITLAIYQDEIPAARLCQALDKVARDWAALPVALSGIGVFPGPCSVLWVAPVVTSQLLARHAAVQAALPGLEVHAHYEPNVWMPHVTLSAALVDPGQAMMVLLPSWRPITGLLVRLDLIRFRPVEVLQSYVLPS